MSKSKVCRGSASLGASSRINWASSVSSMADKQKVAIEHSWDRPPSSVGERYDPLRLVRLRAEGGADALSSSCTGAIVPVLLESERSQSVQRRDRLVAVR